MDWSEFRSSAGVAASITGLAFRFADEIFKGKPTPELLLDLRPTGSSTSGITFTSRVSEIGNVVPAVGVYVYAELEDLGVVYEAAPFNLGAGQLDESVRFALNDPGLGTTVAACNGATTLYGRTLTVTAVSDNGGAATAEWREIEPDPITEQGQYQAMQEAWPAERRHRPE